MKEISKALITGVAGFLGSHLAERLHSQGVDVVGLDNFLSGNVKNLSALRAHKGFSLVEGDILKHENLSKAFKDVDAVFHFAAQSSVPKSTEDPTRDFEINVQGTLNVLELARKAEIKGVIFASSSAVYGGAIPSRLRTTRFSLSQITALQKPPRKFIALLIFIYMV